MDFTTIVLSIGVILSLALIGAGIFTRRLVWGLLAGLVVFLTVTILLAAPLHLILIGAGSIILGVILWVVWLGKKLALLAVAFVIVPLLSVLGGAVFAQLSSTPAAAAGGIESIAFNPEVDFLPTEAKCTSNLFVDHSVRTVEAGNPEKKQFSTAVSIPFKGTDDAAVLKEMTLTELCANPTALQMVVNDMLLWDSKDIPGANENKSWLNKIKADIDHAPLGINSFVEKSPTGVLVVTPTYQKYAAWVNTVLLRSVAEGKQSLTSTRNWEISAAVDPSKGLPSVQEAVEQENKPAWVRSFISKEGTCLLRFGFNAADRRMEIFDCKKPAPPEKPAPAPEKPAPAPETPTQSKPNPPVTPPQPSTPPSGGCKENCGGTTPPPPTNPPVTHVCPPDMPNGTWPVCKDAPSNDPEPKGNNKPGGGGVAPPVTEPASPPAAGNPAPVYTPPPVVQKPAPTVKPVPRPTSEPVPTVAPSTQPPNNGEVVKPDPGETCSAEAREFGLC